MTPGVSNLRCCFEEDPRPTPTWEFSGWQRHQEALFASTQGSLRQTHVAIGKLPIRQAVHERKCATT